MAFALGAAEFDAVLYVDYFDTGGEVLHLTPSAMAPRRNFARGERIRLGGEGAGGIGMSAAPPFGKDLLVALAASHPLYEGIRPAREDGLGYLRYLAERIAATREAEPGFCGEWVYIFVEMVPWEGERS